MNPTTQRSCEVWQLFEFTARAGGRALKSIGSITETIEDLVARNDLNAQYVPKFACWQTQLLIIDDIKGDENYEELPVVQEVRPQHLASNENPLRVADHFEYILGQQRRRRRRTLRRTRRAQIPRLAREREQLLLGAVGTPDTRKPVLKQPAVEVPQHLLVDEAAPETAPSLEALLPLPPYLVEVGLEEAIEGRRAGIPGPVTRRAGLSHSDARRLLQRGRAASA